MYGRGRGRRSSSVEDDGSGSSARVLAGMAHVGSVSADQNLCFDSHKSVIIVLMLYMTCASCLDWSGHEDIQTGTVRGRLSWTGRRYLAGTIRERPSWYINLLPGVQGTPSWFTSLEQEQHEDQEQNNKKSRVQVQRDEVQNSSSADQVQCTREVFKCRAVYKSSDQVAPAELSSTADCDDITADVIITDSRSCASSQLLIVMMSSLLLIASSRIYADVITADSRFLFASIQQLISSTSEHCSLLLNFSSSILLQ
ncbi:hypothetical protein F511_24351 [Dorcoceras hygrometricum]|uniref:Uncharacterized protein n=1 Tax=Dorcoceras hygrometricum TaxID=472368 RepID=A0A2Z7DE40_9LAMI|nr:hypothetical protein F511_24351 [Dorcoceras hygrometricum]